MVLGPGSAFEVGVTSRLQLCMCVHTKILLKAMKHNVWAQNYLLT